MDDISIDVVDDDGGESVSLFARYLGQRVGYAWLAIEGDQAKLVDIHLYRRDSRWHWWPPFYYRGVNYREGEWEAACYHPPSRYARGEEYKA